MTTESVRHKSCANKKINEGKDRAELPRVCIFNVRVTYEVLVSYFYYYFFLACHFYFVLKLTDLSPNTFSEIKLNLGRKQPIICKQLL